MVLGSEIMKKANSSSAPLSSRWNGIVSGSPSASERPNSAAAQNARKASVTSARAARWTTRPPMQAMRKANVATLPH